MSKTFTSVHDLFKATDSDITIISSDLVAFKLHRKFLDTTTGVFPGSELVDNEDEPIQLAEPACVLALVFQFIYPKRHPKLNEEDFETTLAVAEAVEKYQVYSAMNTCETRLINYLPGKSTDQAAEILGHGIKHNYPDLINAAVPYLSRASLMPLLQKIPPFAVLCWVRYHEQWKSVFAKAFQYVNSKAVQLNECAHSNICFNCRNLLITRITEFERLETLSELTASLEIQQNRPDNPLCNPCRNASCKYQADVINICKEGIKSMPPFTEFLSKLQS